MANKNIEQFIATYGPVAQQVSKEINVDPNVLLSQWGLESRWGTTDMAKKHHNLGGIKDFSGSGFEAKDNKTGSVDKYVKFEDPEVFGMYYVDQIKRNFPGAVNTGPDVGAFTRGLASGKKGSYFEISSEEYLKSLTNAQSALPESKEPPARQDDGDLKLGPPPPRPPPSADKSGADRAEKFLFGGIGAGVGATTTGAGLLIDKMDSNAVRRAAAEESARIRVRRDEANARTALLREQQAAQRLAGMQVPGAVPPLTSPLGGLSSGAEASPQAVRIQQGTTGDLGTTGRARMTGFNTETSQMSEAQKAAYARAQMLKNMGVVAQDAPEFFSRQPGMTSSPSGVLFPRSELPPPTTLGPRGPEGQIGGGTPRPPPPIPSVLAGATPGEVSLRPPSSPSMGTKVMSGLDTVTDLFKSMMRPISTAVGTVGKYVSGPLGGLSAGLDVAEIAHEYGKPQDQRDSLKMGLKGLSAASGIASMVPGLHQLATIPVSIGASAAQAYRDDPEYFKQKMKEYTGYSP